MNADLSLLPNQAKFRAARIKLKEKINSFALFFSIIWLILISIVFMSWFLVGLQLNNINRTYQNVNNQYKSMFEDLAISRQVKLDAKLVGTILSERFEYGKSLKNINSLFSSLPNVILGDSSLKEVNQFILKGAVAGSRGMDSVEEKIRDINSGKLDGFVKSRLTNLSVVNNIWQFEMEVTVK